MASEGLRGYFDYLQNKTFIDKYPKSIITLDELLNKGILEIGAGTFNDMLFLIQMGVTNANDIYISEPYIPAFCESLDKIEEALGPDYAFKNRARISYKAFPNPDFPDACVDVVYANNVLHSLGYRSLEDDLDLKRLEDSGEGDPNRIQQLLRSRKEKVSGCVQEAFRLLRPQGIFFGRNLADYVDLAILAKLEAEQARSKTDEFAIWTARAVLDGTLIGLDPLAFAELGKSIGFKRVYTEVEPVDPTKPRRNFYFRFEK